MVIHHTDWRDAHLHERGHLGEARIRNGQERIIDRLLAFSEVEASVKEDVGTIRKNPFLPKDVEVTGWIYDTTTGRLRGLE
jgi:carbonic anhydrase